MRQIIYGVKDIQSLGIIHRDLKAANIFLHFPDNPELKALSKYQKIAFLANIDLTKTNFQVKISDFGLSTIEADSNQMIGTPLYSSPEMHEGKSYSSKLDSWALGVILFELLMGGVTPF